METLTSKEIMALLCMVEEEQAVVISDKQQAALRVLEAKLRSAHNAMVLGGSFRHPEDLARNDAA